MIASREAAIYPQLLRRISLVILASSMSITPVISLLRVALSSESYATLSNSSLITLRLDSYCLQSRSRKSAQDDKWSFCLMAGTLWPANQERP